MAYYVAAAEWIMRAGMAMPAICAVALVLLCIFNPDMAKLYTAQMYASIGKYSRCIDAAANQRSESSERGAPGLLSLTRDSYEQEGVLLTDRMFDMLGDDFNATASLSDALSHMWRSGESSATIRGYLLGFMAHQRLLDDAVGHVLGSAIEGTDAVKNLRRIEIDLTEVARSNPSGVAAEKRSRHRLTVERVLSDKYVLPESECQRQQRLGLPCYGADGKCSA